jgi:biopolymer transport protein ExbD
MRTPTFSRSARSGINMTPMIDVVFLLIIFFLVSSHLARQDATLPVSLPVAASADEDPSLSSSRITLTVTDDGAMHLGGQPLALDQLPSRLATAIRSYGGDIEVRLRASRVLPYRQVEPIMVACARAGVWNVTFAVFDREPSQ